MSEQARKTRHDVCRARLQPGLIAVVMLLAGMAAPAQAEFRVCNQTLSLFNLAIGYPIQDELFETEGWWTLAANSCTSLIKEPLKASYYYLYGTDIYGEPAIVGSTEMCVAAKQQFIIPDQKDCWVRGYEQARFLEVDTRNASSWTVFIRER
jgi:uncharacterized membrane protein